MHSSQHEATFSEQQVRTADRIDGQKLRGLCNERLSHGNRDHAPAVNGAV